jgi:hypothetical protein
MTVYCNLEYYRITKLNWKNKEGVLADCGTYRDDVGID